MANQWFKFYGGEYLSDPKIDRLTCAERSCWVTLLCLASMSNKDGLIEYIDVHNLLKKSGIEKDIYGGDNTYDNTLNVINTFQSMNMVTILDENTIQLNNWCNRQSMSMTGYERVKKYRENKKKSTNDNEMITHDNVSDNVRIEENRIEEKRIDILKRIVKKKEVGYSDIFEIFWSGYPEKIGKGKAYESWNKLTKEEQENCVTQIKLQVVNNHFKNKQGIDFIPHPTTWLNQRRWEDEVKVKEKLETIKLDKYGNITK